MGIENISKIWNEWNIGKCIGEGSFGKVYRAEKSVAGFVTPAAIKVISIPSTNAELDALRSEGMSISETKEYFEDVVKGFINEIKLMSELKGAPNIVNVEDYSILEKSDVVGWDIFIRMELLESFKDYLDTHTPTEDEVIKLGCDIATALEICQQRHIIHRDIKPANIFIDNYGSFKLGDFGIAKELEKTSGAVSSKGTFSFMAPEVARGQRYDSTVDIYSLGLVMYSLLNNNRPPFIDPAAPKVTYNDRKEANDRRLAGEPLPPPRNASPNLANVIMMACSHDPNLRFKSATAFKNALLNCKNIKPVPIPIKEEKPDIDETVAVTKPKKMTGSEPQHTKELTKAKRYESLEDFQRKHLTEESTIFTSDTTEDPKKIKRAKSFAIVMYVFSFIVVLLIIVGGIINAINTDTGSDMGIDWKYSYGTLSFSSSKDDVLDDRINAVEKFRDKATELYIEDDITDIDPYTFEDYDKLTKVSISSDLKSIQNYAFKNCDQLEEIHIPDTVTFISATAFINTDVTIVAPAGSYALKYAKANNIDYKIE